MKTPNKVEFRNILTKIKHRDHINKNIVIITELALFSTFFAFTKAPTSHISFSQLLLCLSPSFKT